MNIIEKFEKNPHLIKHSAVVHITNKITLLERKAFNILLKNAFEDLGKRDIHEISVNHLKKMVGWSGNGYQDLKKSLYNLRELGIVGNIFGKDKQNVEDINIGLLGSVHIKPRENICEYEFPKKLIHLLNSPNIYAVLNLEVQNKFKSKHSIAIWEFCIEDLSVKKVNSTNTKYITIEELKKMLFLTEDKYKQFFEFNRSVLKPSIFEINSKSDINISINTKKQNRKVSHISFFVERKDADSKITTFEEDLSIAKDRYKTKLNDKKEGIIEGEFEEINTHTKNTKKNKQFTQEEVKNSYSEILSEDKKNNPIVIQYPFNLNRIDELINLGISKKDIEKEFNKLSQEMDNFSEDNIEKLLYYFLNQDDVKNVISGKREVKSKPSYIFTLIKNRSFLNQETLIKIIKKSETDNQKEEEKESLTKKYQIRNAEPFWRFISNYLDLKRAEDWGKILKFELLNFSLIENKVMYLILSKSNDNSKDKFHRDNLLREKENLILTINKMLQMDVFKDIGQINNLKISIEDEYSFRG